MITLLYFLNKSCLICLICLPVLAYVIKNKYRLATWKVYLMTCVAVYVMLLITAWTSDVYLEAVLQSYDINQDGFFSDDEINPQQQKALQNVTNDTGRRLVLFTGLFISPVMVSVYFVGCFVIDKTIHLLRKPKI